VSDLRVVIDADVQPGTERARGERVDSDFRVGRLDGQALTKAALLAAYPARPRGAG
jgi:hypothetical protein